MLPEYEKKYNEMLETQKRIKNITNTREFNLDDGFNILSITYDSVNPISINGTNYNSNNTRVMGFSVVSDKGLVAFQLGIITFSNTGSLIGKIIYRYRHGSTYSNNWTLIQ